MMLVEQTSDYALRLQYNPATNTFIETQWESLLHQKGFTHPYGWLKGSGTPPGPHLDVFLLSVPGCAPGDELPVRIVGVFRRNDGDHKLVAVAPHRPETDLAQLPAEEQEDLRRLYTKNLPGEGWFGAEEARRIMEEFHRLGRRPVNNP